jgi:hypothetical protein
VKSATEQVVSVQVMDDSPNVTVALRLFCPSTPDAPPVILGTLIPVVNGVATDTVTQGQQGCVIDAVASDGFSSSANTEVAPSELNNVGAESSVTINTPTPSEQFLQYDGITFSGSGYTSGVNGGIQPASALSWSSTLPGFGSHSGTDSFTVSPPATAAGETIGWTPGIYTVTLSGSGGATTTRSFQILPDNDHDGIPASNDTGCLSGGDSNAFNAGSDTDQDGLTAVNDQYLGTVDPFSNNAICTPASSYLANILLFPGTIDTSSTSTTFSLGGIFVANRDLRQVPDSSVKITTIAGLTANIPATQWVVSGANGGTLGVAAFNLQDIIKFLNQNNIHNRGVLLCVGGQATAGQLKALTTWRFDGCVTDLVK